VAYVIDAGSGQVIWSLRAAEPRPIASTTKILTALVVKAAGDLDKVVSIDATPAIRDGTVGLGPADHLTRRQLLYLMLLKSANDAAYVLADDVGGSQSAFAARMNAYAVRAGTTNVHMTNPHGLPDPRHKATAMALARWAQLLLDDPVLAEIVRTKRYALGRFGTIRNTNWLLWTDPRIIGVKTGYTDSAGYCLVAAGRTSYATVIAVVLGDPIDVGRFRDAERLLEWAYTQYRMRPLADVNRVYALPRIPAWNGLPVPLVARTSLTTMTLAQTQFAEEVVAPAVVEPPVRKGETLGFLRLSEQGRTIAVVPLEASASVRRPTSLESLRLFLLDPSSAGEKARILWDQRSLVIANLRGVLDRLFGGHVRAPDHRGGGVRLGSS
jgi:serine-type D-Ala-D-Ala carboxypeptidase (penicillin-binding protein 5/6)